MISSENCGMKGVDITEFYILALCCFSIRLQLDTTSERRRSEIDN
jgi:hypothetical protein